MHLCLTVASNEFCESILHKAFQIQQFQGHKNTLFIITYFTEALLYACYVCWTIDCLFFLSEANAIGYIIGFYHALSVQLVPHIECQV